MKKILEQLKESKMGKLFFSRKFAHYTWIGVFISLLNIFLLWLMIDIFHIGTVISSAIVIGATFILRYLLFRRFEAL